LRFGICLLSGVPYLNTDITYIIMVIFG
jgi:hypothetical protein